MYLIEEMSVGDAYGRRNIRRVFALLEFMFSVNVSASLRKVRIPCHNKNLSKLEKSYHLLLGSGGLNERWIQ